MDRLAAHLEHLGQLVDHLFVLLTVQSSVCKSLAGRVGAQANSNLARPRRKYGNTTARDQPTSNMGSLPSSSLLSSLSPGGLSCRSAPSAESWRADSCCESASLRSEMCDTIGAPPPNEAGCDCCSLMACWLRGWLPSNWEHCDGWIAQVGIAGKAGRWAQATEGCAAHGRRRRGRRREGQRQKNGAQTPGARRWVRRRAWRLVAAGAFVACRDGSRLGSLSRLKMKFRWLTKKQTLGEEDSHALPRKARLKLPPGAGELLCRIQEKAGQRLAGRVGGVQR